VQDTAALLRGIKADFNLESLCLSAQLAALRDAEGTRADNVAVYSSSAH